MSSVGRPGRQRGAWQRNASVLLWAPVLLLVLIPELIRARDADGLGALLIGVVLIGVIISAGVTAVLTNRPAGHGVVGYVAFGVQAAATVATAAYPEPWLATWILLALTAPSVLRGRWLLGAVPTLAAAAMAAAWLTGAAPERIAVQGFLMLLALGANTAVVRLIETVDELRRTREELARRAVLQERERFSQDLHDLLGHTLSVIVVKAEAVRKLARRDPAAAAEHAGDIERVGRDALSEVRQAVDGTRVSSLVEELDGARRALAAAGIRGEVATGLPTGGPIPPRPSEVLAWVVREGVTNVLRHSGARWCGIELIDDGRLTLRIADDGGGGPLRPDSSSSHAAPVAGDPAADDSTAGLPRTGGLDGLRRRLAAVDGWLEVDHDPNGTRGFVLIARVPKEER